jgi:uncharacterized coiled-coil protein SlyX
MQEEKSVIHIPAILTVGRIVGSDEYEALKKENEALKKENQYLKSRITELEHNADMFRQQIETDRLTIEELKKENAFLRKKIEQLEKQIAEQNTKIAEQEIKIDEQNVKIYEQNSKIFEQNSKIVEQEIKIAEQNTKIAEQEIKIDEQNTKIAEQNTKIIGQDYKIKCLENENIFRTNKEYVTRISIGFQDLNRVYKLETKLQQYGKNLYRVRGNRNYECHMFEIDSEAPTAKNAWLQVVSNLKPEVRTMLDSKFGGKNVVDAVVNYLTGIQQESDSDNLNYFLQWFEDL